MVKYEIIDVRTGLCNAFNDSYLATIGMNLSKHFGHSSSTLTTLQPENKCRQCFCSICW